MRSNSSRVAFRRLFRVTFDCNPSTRRNPKGAIKKENIFGTRNFSKKELKKEGVWNNKERIQKYQSGLKRPKEVFYRPENSKFKNPQKISGSDSSKSPSNYCLHLITTVQGSVMARAYFLEENASKTAHNGSVKVISLLQLL